MDSLVSRGRFFPSHTHPSLIGQKLDTDGLKGAGHRLKVIGDGIAPALLEVPDRTKGNASGLGEPLLRPTQ